MNPLLARASLSFAQRHKVLVTAAALVLPLMIVAGPFLALMVIVLAIAPESADASNSTTGCNESGVVNQASGGPDVGSLTDEQITNARTILAVARRHKVPEYGSVVALSVALQESTLVDLNAGDRDSAGLFQQRPSQGWGSFSQVVDPTLAAEAFFGVAQHTGNRGLLDVVGWQTMEVTVAAQAVQGSAYPDAYRDDEPLARQLVSKLAGGGATGGPLTCGTGSAMDCPATGLDVEVGLTSDALRVVRCVQREFGDHVYLGVGERPDNSTSDHPTGRAVDVMIDRWDTARGNAAGWRIARWVVDNRAGMGVSYVIWDAKIWSTDRASEGWRPYSHPSGASDPTSDHLDHLHISVYGNAASDETTGAYVLPVRPGTYVLTARFGECGPLWESCHTGLDFDTPNGAGIPIHAVTDGTIVEATSNCGSPDVCPYGTVTRLEISPTTTLRFAHQMRLASGVRVGAHVRADQVIGYVGTTGNSTGDHLHFEVMVNDQLIDPEPWLEAHGLDP